MPILPSVRRRPVDAFRRVSVYLYSVANGGPAASLLVAGIAILLWALRVELQFVAGAFLIYAAQRLAQKKITPNLVIPVPPKQPVRETLDGKSLPKGPAS